MPLAIPFFIFDIYNAQLITSAQIPSTDITDSKQIVISETPIPGLGFSPITPGGMSNRKISFTLPLVKKNGAVGNIMMLKQFEALRYPSNGIGMAMFNPAKQFNPAPKVLFHWGTGSSVPLEYFVSKCDFVHKSGFVNAFGYPQFTEISMELILDETAPVYRAEEIFRNVTMYAAMTLGIVDLFSNPLKDPFASSGTKKISGKI